MKVKNGRIVKQEFNKTYIILIIFIVILMIFNLILLLKKVVNPKQQDETQANYSQNLSNTEKENNNNTKKIPTTEEEVIKYLSTLKEGNRMEYYCGQFINSIDEENYEKAYSLLYDEFRDKYFPTLQDFEKYAKNFYPKFFGLEYDDVDRYNDTYVIRLKIVDYKANESEEPKVQRIVIREYSYNNYTISFSVDTDLLQNITTNNTESPTIIIN